MNELRISIGEVNSILDLYGDKMNIAKSGSKVSTCFTHLPIPFST